MTLWEEIVYKRKQLNETLSQLKNYGLKYAEAEKNYKIAFRVEILKLRDEGHSVTLCSSLAKGTNSIANLRFKRDIAESLYKSCQEGLNVFKLELRIIESQLQREWGASGKNT